MLTNSQKGMTKHAATASACEGDSALLYLIIDLHVLYIYMYSNMRESRVSGGCFVSVTSARMPSRIHRAILKLESGASVE